MKTIYMVRLPNSSMVCIADLSPPGVELIPDVWWIHRINVPQPFRGYGYGTQVLLDILKDADGESATLALSPLATGGLSQVDLEAWYMRYGFEWKNTPAPYLRREPHAA